MAANAPIRNISLQCGVTIDREVTRYLVPGTEDTPSTQDAPSTQNAPSTQDNTWYKRSRTPDIVAEIQNDPVGWYKQTKKCGLRDLSQPFVSTKPLSAKHKKGLCRLGSLLLAKTGPTAQDRNAAQAQNRAIRALSGAAEKAFTDNCMDGQFEEWKGELLRAMAQLVLLHAEATA